MVTVDGWWLQMTSLDKNGDGLTGVPRVLRPGEPADARASWLAFMGPLPEFS